MSRNAVAHLVALAVALILMLSGCGFIQRNFSLQPGSGEAFDEDAE
jgi:hypothetical protein